MGEISKITDKETLLIFTYSPAGLGHLRVTEALFNGIPKNTYPILLGSQDKRITYIHRVMSVHDITRRLFEWLQIGRAEEITTPMYRFYLRTHTGMLTRQINTIIDQSFTNPQTILIVATHFGLAHQAAQLKEQLKKNRRLNVKIMVQVTDDSPQHIWYVPGADLTLVPSNRTRDQLIAYGKSANLAETNIQINPYPLSPHLNGVLPLNDQLSRFNQLDAKANAPIHLVFPISGAAVGAALAGMRPILMHPRMDFMYYAMDQIANQAANWYYMSGGQVNVPLTIWAIINRGGEQAAQHSQALQAMFMHIPGLKVVMPSTPYDAKGLLVASVKDDNPVVYIDDRWLYNHVGEVPEELYSVPIGKGIVRRKGKDVIN